jgi:phospholipid/cholesterol/gamma-HCH transport system substrate-binding protein
MTYRASRRGPVLVLLAFVVLAAAVFIWLYGQAGGRIALDSPYRVAVVLPDANLLERGADVRAAGVRIGRVADVRPSGQASVVTMQIDSRYAPVPKDSRVQLRTRTLVGENALDLDLGNPANGVVGSSGTLPLSAAEESVQIDQVLKTLPPATRRELAGIVTELGNGVRGRGIALNETLSNLGRVATSGAGVARILAAHDRQVADVLADGGKVLDALGRRQDALRGLIVDGRRAATAAAARDDELRATLRRLPAALRAAIAATGELRRLAVVATPVVGDLRIASRRLRPAMAELAPAAEGARRLTARLPRAARRLDALLPRLSRFARQVTPAFAPLRSVLAQLEPLTGVLAPYGEDLGAWFQALGAAASVYDANGHAIRVQPLFDELTIAGSLPPALQKVVDEAGKASPLAVLRSTSFNAYPAPRTADAPQPLTAAPPRVGGPERGSPSRARGSSSGRRMAARPASTTVASR